jgi:hypothetical protein
MIIKKLYYENHENKLLFSADEDFWVSIARGQNANTWGKSI